MYLKITDLQSMIMLKQSVVNTLIYNKLFLKCHVGFYTRDVPWYLQQSFLSGKDATNPLIYCISIQSSKAIVSVQNYQMSGYSMSDT